MIAHKHTHNARRNPLRVDPTRTITLRKRFMREMFARFNRLKAEITRLVDTQDAFGLKPRHRTLNQDEPRGDRAFAFQSTSQQVQEFEAWLATRIDEVILGAGVAPSDGYWANFVEEGYRKGAGRSFDDARKPFARGFAAAGDDVSDFFKGSRFEFLQSAFGQPESVEKVKLLAGRVFTDLKGVSQAMSTQISRELVQGLSQGDNPKVIARRLNKAVEGIGKVRAKQIAQTEIIRAHAEGQLDSIEGMGFTSVTVMVEWSTAGDDRVCPLCEALDGTVMTIQEARGLIPRHTSCLPGDSLVTAGSRITAVSKRWYDGDMIVITTASGRVLSCTPNHPVLTNGGWVPAESLDLGSKVVCDGASEWEKGLTDRDNENVPTSIHDVAEAFLSDSQVVSGPVPLTAEDFHGDGAESKVAIIGTDSRLGGHVDTPAGHCPLHGQLDGGTTDVSSLPGGSPLTPTGHSVGHASGSLVGGGDLVSPSPVVHLAPLDGFSLGSRAERDTALSEPSVDGPTTGPEFLSNLVRGLPAGVFLDDVVHVERNAVNCHVYNLQTENEWYTANGIITHNCRCAFTPANVGEQPKGRDQKSIQQAIDQSVSAELPKGRVIKGEGRRYQDPITGTFIRKKNRTLAQQKRRSTWPGAHKKIAKKRPKAFVVE